MHNKSLNLDTKYILYLLVAWYCKTIIRLNKVFQKSLLFFICPWSTICPSSLTLPSCFLSRRVGLHALAPSMGRILKMSLSLLAFRQFQNIFLCGRKWFLKAAPMRRVELLPRLTRYYHRILPRVCRGRQGGWGPPLYCKVFFNFFCNETL